MILPGVRRILVRLVEWILLFEEKGSKGDKSR